MKKLFYSSLILLAACSAQKLDKSADTESKASVVSLTRIFQRVIRYDCAGHVISDGIETTQSPVSAIDIQPNTRLNIDSSDFENLTLQTKPGCVVDHSKFNLDYSYGLCNMRVASGVNQIHYRFYYCDKKTTTYDSQGNPSTTCDSAPELREEGSLWVNVYYEEINRPEIAERRPSPESCKETGTTSRPK